MRNNKHLALILVVATMLSTTALFTSCRHDDSFNGGSIEEAVNATYAQAFENAFGKVAPNVDWGFSSNPSSMRTSARAMGTNAMFRRSLQPTISFPTDYVQGYFVDDFWWK